MPELPEVEHARRTLVRALDEDVIVRAESSDPMVVAQGSPSFAEALVGARLAHAERRGKSVLLTLAHPDGREVGLFFHLGMTGRLEVRDASATETPRFGRFVVATDKRRVTLIDARRLGRAIAGPRDDVARRSGFDKLGPDALSITTGEALSACYRGRSGKLPIAPIKLALMDQKKLAGLGNIHAVEALFLAKLHPEKATSTLKQKDWDALARGIQQTLSRTLADLDDTKELVYVSEGGPNPFFVYGKADEPCPVCGAKIRREEHEGRGTYFCATCQKKPRSSAG